MNASPTTSALVGLAVFVLYIVLSAALKSISKTITDPHYLVKDLGTVTTNAYIILKSHYYIWRSFTVVEIWNAAVRANAHREFLVFENQSWTYHDVDFLVNRLARWMRSLGVVQGDVIALMMENRPQYVCVWLAAAKCGAVTALVNYNLKGQPLAHCVDIAAPKLIIADEVSLTNIVECFHLLKRDASVAPPPIFLLRGCLGDDAAVPRTHARTRAQPRVPAEPCASEYTASEAAVRARASAASSAAAAAVVVPSPAAALVDAATEAAAADAAAAARAAGLPQRQGLAQGQGQGQGRSGAGARALTPRGTAGVVTAATVTAAATGGFNAADAHISGGSDVSVVGDMCTAPSSPYISRSRRIGLASSPTSTTNTTTGTTSSRSPSTASRSLSPAATANTTTTTAAAVAGDGDLPQLPQPTVNTKPSKPSPPASPTATAAAAAAAAGAEARVGGVTTVVASAFTSPVGSPLSSAPTSPHAPSPAAAAAAGETAGEAAEAAAFAAAAADGRVYRPVHVRVRVLAPTACAATVESEETDSDAARESKGGAAAGKGVEYTIDPLAPVHASPAHATAEPTSSADNPAPLVYVLDDVFAADALRGQRARFTGAEPPAEWRSGVGFADTALLIYTSGTTGLPKAAAIRHNRLYGGGLLFARHYGLRPDDRYYTPLPLYHSAATVVCVMATVVTGATVVLTRRFSASRFWDDCVAHQVTVIQYIGELCRYLLSAPVSDMERRHRVRLAIGNGLRPDVWEPFQTRFGIGEIGEFYAATEGNAGLFNHCTRPRDQGAIGHMGSLVHWFSGMRLVRYDVEADEIVRDPATGLCVPCAPGEAGELVSKIVAWDPMRTFAGYHKNAEGTGKKIISDVFAKGDRYFRTGDLLRVDQDGYWFFVDRVGDTFRWKGENVSTNEVQEVVSHTPGGVIAEVNVYGAEVPHKEGRACMAAIVWDKNAVAAAGGEEAALEAVSRFARGNLPVYAVPVFVREMEAVEITSTFKHKKSELRTEGADPSKVAAGTKVWVLDFNTQKYVPMTEAKWAEISLPTAKL